MVSTIPVSASFGRFTLCNPSSGRRLGGGGNAYAMGAGCLMPLHRDPNIQRRLERRSGLLADVSPILTISVCQGVPSSVG